METIHPEKWQLGIVFLPDSIGYLIGTNFFAVPALKFGRHWVAMIALLMVSIGCISLPEATSILGLALPHFMLGLGIGIIDSALMPLLATLIDEEEHGKAYGSVYAIAQTAVSLAYGVGPLLGGYLSETVGFTIILRTVGCINFCYIPILFFLKKSTSTDRSGYEQHSNVEQQVELNEM